MRNSKPWLLTGLYMILSCLNIGDRCRTKSGLYLQHVGGLCFVDKLGKPVYPKNPDEECELDDWDDVGDPLFELRRKASNVFDTMLKNQKSVNL